jgi:hypothetical protein
MKIERCGYCGRHIKDGEYMSAEEEDALDVDLMMRAPLGYCPNAQQEHCEQNPETCV